MASAGANRNAEKCDPIASHKPTPESNMAAPEFLNKARSNRYADPRANARNKAYWRISVESSIDEGRKRTKTYIIQATAFSNNICAQRNVNQQKAMPAKIDGMRNISSEAPSTRQM